MAKLFDYIIVVCFLTPPSHIYTDGLLECCNQVQQLYWVEKKKPFHVLHVKCYFEWGTSILFSYLVLPNLALSPLPFFTFLFSTDTHAQIYYIQLDKKIYK